MGVSAFDLLSENTLRMVAELIVKKSKLVDRRLLRTNDGEYRGGKPPKQFQIGFGDGCHRTKRLGLRERSLDHFLQHMESIIST